MVKKTPIFHLLDKILIIFITFTDEFSSDDEGTKSEASKLTTDSSKQPMTVLGKCKALYSYTPKLYDELELFPDDIIEIHHKQDDGWWLGSLRNNVGIFPATYVEEIE